MATRTMHSQRLVSVEATGGQGHGFVRLGCPKVGERAGIGSVYFVGRRIIRLYWSTAVPANEGGSGSGWQRQAMSGRVAVGASFLGFVSSVLLWAD